MAPPKKPRRKNLPRQSYRSAWRDLSGVKKMFLGLGSIAVSIIAISGAYGVGERVFENHRPWAERRLEIEVAGLQLESLRAKEQQNRFQQFQLEDEKRREGQRFPRWKDELLHRIRFEQQQIQHDIKRLEGRR